MMHLRRTVAVRAALASLAWAIWTAAADAAVRPEFAEGGTFATGFLDRNDDLSTGLIDVGFTLNFFGVTTDTLYVNNNGNVTLDESLGEYTPFDLTSTNRQILAPFFADVDTRNSDSGIVTFGQGTVNGRSAFGVTWNSVGYYSFGADKLNTFQLVLIDRSDVAAGDFDIEFNYDQIQWETGGASGGSGGLGGNSARVGFSNGTGDPGTFFELPGSAINGAFLDGGPFALISNRLNSSVDGRYVFRAQGGDVIVDPVPEPSSMALMAVGLAGLAVAARRRGRVRAGRPAGDASR